MKVGSVPWLRPSAASRDQGRRNPLVSIENLLSCWHEFRKDKKNKFDVTKFERRLEDNIFQLHEELKNQTIQSYLGLLKHCEGYKVKQDLERLIRNFSA